MNDLSVSDFSTAYAQQSSSFWFWSVRTNGIVMIYK